MENVQLPSENMKIQTDHHPNRNQFITDNACPNYISMNFNKIGTRTTSQQTQSKDPCKKPGHCLCSDEYFDRTNVMIEEQEQIMNDQPMSQPFHPTELISLPVM